MNRLVVPSLKFSWFTSVFVRGGIHKGHVEINTSATEICHAIADVRSSFFGFWIP